MSRELIRSLEKDYDKLTSQVKHLRTQQGVCKEDVLSLESYITKPLLKTHAIHTFTDYPTRTGFNQIVDALDKERHQIKTDILRLEIARISNESDPFIALEGFNPKHFLIFGGLSASDRNGLNIAVTMAKVLNANMQYLLNISLKMARDMKSVEKRNSCPYNNLTLLPQLHQSLGESIWRRLTLKAGNNLKPFGLTL